MGGTDDFGHRALPPLGPEGMPGKQMSTFKDILIVCTGNICRSPAAEFIFKSKLKQVSDMNVGSAGLVALEGYGIHPVMKALLDRRNIDAESHHARQVRHEMLVRADLILTMDQAQLWQILRLNPLCVGRAYLLGYWSGNLPVLDPFQKSDEIFKREFEKIDVQTDQWISQLVNASLI